MKLTFSTHRGGDGAERQASWRLQPVPSSAVFTRAQVLCLSRAALKMSHGDGGETSHGGIQMDQSGHVCYCGVWWLIGRIKGQKDEGLALAALLCVTAQVTPVSLNQLWTHPQPLCIFTMAVLMLFVVHASYVATV